MKKRSVAIIIPAHNEEKVIVKTIQSLKKLVPAKDIYVANDGSKDKTGPMARKQGVHVLDIISNKGKANAINTVIITFKLVKHYEFIMPVDADTLISQDFLDHVLPVFKADKKHKIAAVIGKVVGKNVNWVTRYRIWEYEISQSIHKAAQSVIGAIIVCPGPSTVFRSSVFEKILLPVDTVTEDMDFTFMIHRQKLGKIIFCEKALVITQDPKTLKDLRNQLNRWYKGFWQCVFKYNIPWGGQRLDAEVAMCATDGLFNGIIVASLFIMSPFTILYRSPVLLAPIIFDFMLFFLPTLLFTSYRNPKLFIRLLFDVPLFYAVRLLAGLLFVRSFFATVIETQLNIHAVWDTKRYELDKEEIWQTQSAR